MWVSDRYVIRRIEDGKFYQNRNYWADLNCAALYFLKSECVDVMEHLPSDKSYERVTVELGSFQIKVVDGKSV